MENPMLAARMSLAFVRIVRDPSRLDVVFDLVDSISSDPKSSEEFARLLADPQVSHAARRRLRLPALDLATLADLPAGSLGEVAGRFFCEHGLDPAALPRREAESDVDWLSAHLYETHDLWHVLTGFGPDVAGELGLQAFYAAQVEGRVALAILCAGLLNTLIFNVDETRARLAAIARGWAMGVRAKKLTGLDWAELLPLPLPEVRRRLAIEIGERDDAMGGLTARPLAA
jgi:ubiquinone biosynthesis protein COQ4